MKIAILVPLTIEEIKALYSAVMAKPEDRTPELETVYRLFEKIIREREKNA